jgi:hypothetical protein
MIQPKILRRSKKMKISWILIILPIVCAIFSDKIDSTVKGNKKVRNVILIFCGGVFLISAVGIISTFFA